MDQCAQKGITNPQECTAPQQHLLLRLWARRGPWFRVAALRYDEVPDAPATASALCTAGLLVAGGACTWASQGSDADTHDRHATADVDTALETSSVAEAWTSVRARAQLADVVQVLTVPELLQLAPMLGCEASGGREVLLEDARRAIKHRHTPLEVVELGHSVARHSFLLCV